MSYPPPPGAPQNPPQQPGYGPPPHMSPPPGSPPGGPGYPPADPYSAPPGDPYALPGQSTPPAFGPPGPGMPPSGPPPPPKKSKLGWILGGVAAVVVLAVAAVGAVVLLGGDSQGSVQSGQTEEDSTDDSTDEGDDGDDGETSDVDPNASQHALDVDFCDNLDYSPLEEPLDFDTPEGEPVDENQVYCSSPTDEEAIVSVRAWQNRDAEEGLEMYESLLEEGMVLNPEPAEGEWDNGETNIKESGGGLLALSGNLVILIEVYSPLDEEIDPEPTQDAVGAVAEDAFELTEV